MTTPNEHVIRERAYHLWEKEGRPHGRELEYWVRAEQEAAVNPEPESKRAGRGRKTKTTASAARKPRSAKAPAATRGKTSTATRKPRAGKKTPGRGND